MDVYHMMASREKGRGPVFTKRVVDYAKTLFLPHPFSFPIRLKKKPRRFSRETD